MYVKKLYLSIVVGVGCFYYIAEIFGMNLGLS
jgi:hypothetical protein